MRNRSRHSRRMVPTNRSAIAFVRGTLMGVLMIRIPFIAEDGVEGGGELRVAISNEELDRCCPFRQVVAKVAGLLGDPARDRIGRHPCEVDPTGVVVDEEQHVEPPEQHSIDAEEVTGDQALGLGPEELSPRGT